MKERTLEFYLREDGPYLQTVNHVINSYLYTLDATPDLFDTIDIDLDGLSSELFVELDKYDKRIKSCFVAAYLAMQEYYETLPSSPEHPEEKNCIEKVLGLFEVDIMLDKKELISLMKQVVDDVKDGLLAWINSAQLQGDYQKAQRVMTITYISLRTLWIKLSMDWKVKFIVSQDIKTSLAESQGLLRQAYTDWSNRKEKEVIEQEQQELLREANSDLTEQIDSMMGRLQKRLISDRESTEERYEKNKETAAFIYPLTKILCDYQYEGDLIKQLSHTYVTLEQQTRLFHFLNLSANDHARVQSALRQTTSFYDYFNLFSTTGDLELYHLLKAALEKSVVKQFDELSADSCLSIHDVHQHLEHHQSGRHLGMRLKSIENESIVLANIGELLHQQLSQLSSLKIQSTGPAFFEAFVGEIEVTDAIKVSVIQVREQLVHAKNALESKLCLFQEWCQQWQLFDSALKQLNADENHPLHLIKTRMIEELIENILDEQPSATTANLDDCQQIYHDAIASTEQEILNTDELIQVLDHATAERALEALRNYVATKKHCWWHRCLYRLSPTYQACFEAIKEGINEVNNDTGTKDAYTILQGIQQRIQSAVEACSWTIIKRLAYYPVEKVKQNFLFFKAADDSATEAKTSLNPTPSS